MAMDFNEGISCVEKMSPREIPAVAGAHWTTRLSRVADHVEPYAAKRRKPNPVVQRHLPTVTRVGGKLVKTGRTKAAETIRAVSYDVSSLNDKDKLIREVGTGQGKIHKAFKRDGHLDRDEAAAAAVGGATAAVGAKYATSARALSVAAKNPAKLHGIVNEYKHVDTGRRPLNAKGVYNSKFHHDTVKRKLNHGITHWEDAGGVKFQRKMRANPNAKSVRFHPRYAEHKLLHDAVKIAPAADRKLYRGVTMHPDEAAKLQPGQRMDRGVESWSDNKIKAKKFADDRIAARDKGNVRVTYKTGKKSKALNIQGQSNYAMHEWVADKPYEIKRVKQTKKGNYKVKVRQLEDAGVHKAFKKKEAAEVTGAGAVGAGAAYGGYLGTGNAIARANNKINAPKYQANRKANDKKVKAVKRELGIPSNKPVAQYRAHEKNAFFANYPKDVPGGKVKRIQSRVWGAEKFGRRKPAVAVAATGAVIAAGAVEHHVKKSYVPGVGWRSASKLTPLQRTKVSGGHAKAKGPTRADAKFKRNMTKVTSDLKSLSPGDARGWKGVRHQPHGMGLRVPGSGQAFTIKTGGRKGDSFIRGSATSRHVRDGIQAHELQHASPKRSSYRLHHQISRDKSKLLREEARADYRSSGHYTDKTSRGVYSDAARARDKAIKAPNRPAKGSKTIQTLRREWSGVDMPRTTNQDNFELHAQNLMRAGQGSNVYSMRGKKAENAVDAYRGVHDKMRSSGAKHRDVRKSLDMHEGVASLVSKMSPDPSELHISGASGRKGKLRKQPPNAVRRVK